MAARLGASTLSEPDGVSALLDNPAGLSLLPAWEVRAYNTQLDSTPGHGAGEGTSLLFGIPVWGPIATGVGFEHVRPGGGFATRVRLSFAASFRVHRTLTMGLTYRHTFADLDPAYDHTNELDLGLLYRPVSFLSIGLGVRDLNTPVTGGAVVPRTWSFGFTWHPGTDRLSIDTGLDVHESSGEVDVVTRLRGEPYPGLELGARLTLSPRGDRVGLDLGTFVAVHFGPGGVEGGVWTGRAPGGTFAFDGFTVGARVSGHAYANLFKRRGGKTVVLELGSVGEVPNPGLGEGQGVAFPSLALLLDRLSRDDTVDGLLIRDRGASYGWAQTEELRTLLAAFKKAGKRLSVHLDQGDLRTMFLYADADDLLVSPAGGLMLTGLRGELTYYRRALDFLRIETQWARYGKYKSFPEAFERTEPSPEDLEARNAILDGIFGAIVTGVASGRKLAPEGLKAILDQGPAVATEAKERGLVDDVCFYDEIDQVLAKRLGRPLDFVRLGGESPRLTRAWGAGPRVAIIPIVGGIVDGRSNTVPFLGTRNVGSQSIVDALDAAQRDPTIAGIVLRIDSPGGSAFASDVIWRKTALVAQKKPVVASMGNVAASGGIYVAMGAPEILASDLTVTGSIGIFTGKVAIGKLLGWLGIDRRTLTRGKYANLFGTDEPWNADEQSLVWKKLGVFYDLFKQRIVDARKLTKDEVEASAQGRVWLGKAARERKLVDGRGGVVEAIKHVLTKAGKEPDGPVELVYLPEPTLLDRVKRSLGLAEIAARVGVSPETLALVLPFIFGFAAGEPLAMLPFALDVR